MGVTPRHRAIADELRDVILGEGELLGVRFVSGTKLPSELALAKHFEASRGTIRAGLDALSTEGLTETRGRAGTYVRRLPVLVHSAHSESPARQGTSDTWHAEVLASGRTPTQDFGFKIVPAEPSVARRLRIEPDTLVVVRECTRFVDEVPWSVQVSFYEYNLAKRCHLDVPHDIPEGTVRRMAKYGVVEIGWPDLIATRPPTDDEALLFNLGRNSAVIVYRRVGWTNEAPVRYTREVLPGDRNIVEYRSGDLSALRRLENQGAVDL